MGLFKKLKELITKRKILNKIKEKNAQNNLIESKKFDTGLKKSSSFLASIVNDIAKKYRTVDQELTDKIEEELISFDVGPIASQKILSAIIDELKVTNITNKEQIKQIIIDKLFVYYIQDSNMSCELDIKENQTNVILVTGVNGVGKTTSIAKIANLFLTQKKSVCVVAGDTFRAGAIAQLDEWAKRLKIPIFKPKTEGQDPASVIYEGVKWGNENKIDIILCDTSGRLQNKINLMNELKKIHQVIQKFNNQQPCESLLVLDATTGQNGIQQAKAFNEVTKLTGIILTKMDSTAKGGIVLAIKDVFNLPIKYIGLGETLNDLMPFDLEIFIQSMLKNTNIE